MEPVRDDPPIDLEKVRRFRTALHLALHDVEHPQPQPLVFIFDADAVIGAVVGFTFETKPSAIDLGDWRFAVRALLSTMQLGRVHMLSPHLLEFDRKFHSWPAMYAAKKAGIYREQVNQLIDIWGLRGDEEALADPTALPGLLSSRGFEFFVKVELCFGGTWQQRLNRLRRAGFFAFEPFGSRHHMDVSSPRVADIANALGLESGRSNQTINNLIDAAAIVALEQLPRLYPDRRFRFYTETAAVRTVLDTHCQMLVDESGVSLVRDADYFVMRASIPAFSANRAATVGDMLLDLDGRLSEFLSTNTSDDEKRRAIHRAIVGGIPLPELIDGFFRLKFVRTIVLDRWTTPAGFAEFLPNVKSAFADDTVLREARQQVQESLKAVSSSLEQQIGWLQDWKADCALVAAAVERRRRELGSSIAQPRLDTDIGLARWGITAELAEAERNALNLLVRDIIDPAMPATTLAGRIAMDLADVDDRRHHMLASQVVVLWFLQLNHRLVTLWQRMEEVSTAWTGLRALYLVARVKSAFNASLEHLDFKYLLEFDTCIELAERDLAMASDSRRPFALMSKAHVAYWAWKRLSDTLEPLPDETGGAEGLTDRAQRWAETSYEAAKAAARHLSRQSTEWAFAINHCTYLAYRADMFPDERTRYYTLLNNHALNKHYRFADTLATPHTLLAKRLIEQHGVAALTSRPELQRVRRTCVHELRLAESLLERARPWFGDEEVNAHHRQVTAWLVDLERN